jgi:hypothetical protein
MATDRRKEVEQILYKLHDFIDVGDMESIVGQLCGHRSKKRREDTKTVNAFVALLNERDFSVPESPALRSLFTALKNAEVDATLLHELTPFLGKAVVTTSSDGGAAAAADVSRYVSQ